MGSSFSDCSTLTPGSTWYPLKSTVGEPQILIVEAKKTFAPASNRTPTVDTAHKNVKIKSYSETRQKKYMTGLDDRGSRVRFPAKAGSYSLRHRVQTGSGDHPASYPRGTGYYFLGNKAAEA
jgi:hypothetical protein